MQSHQLLHTTGLANEEQVTNKEAIKPNHRDRGPQ